MFRGKRKRRVIGSRKYLWRKGTGVSSTAIQSDVESKVESKSVSSSTSGFFEQNSEKKILMWVSALKLTLVIKHSILTSVTPVLIVYCHSKLVNNYFLPLFAGNQP